MNSIVLPNRWPWSAFNVFGYTDGFSIIGPKEASRSLSREERYILKALAFAMGRQKRNRGWFFKEPVFPFVPLLLKKCHAEPAEACFDAWLMFDSTTTPPPFARGPFETCGLRKPGDFAFLCELPESLPPMDSYSANVCDCPKLPCPDCGKGAPRG